MRLRVFKFNWFNSCQKSLSFIRSYSNKCKGLLLLLGTLQCVNWIIHFIRLFQLRLLFYQSLLRDRMHTIWFLNTNIHHQRFELLLKYSIKLQDKCVFRFFRVLFLIEFLLLFKYFYCVLWRTRQSICLVRGSHSFLENEFWNGKILCSLLS